MSVEDRIADSSRRRLDETFRRMVDIMGLVCDTEHPEASVEWSALTCAAAVCLAASVGIPPTRENCHRILSVIVRVANPVIEQEVASILRDIVLRS
jgi:hypothetical protein